MIVSVLEIEERKRQLTEKKKSELDARVFESLPSNSRVKGAKHEHLHPFRSVVPGQAEA